MRFLEFNTGSSTTTPSGIVLISGVSTDVTPEARQPTFQTNTFAIFPEGSIVNMGSSSVTSTAPMFFAPGTQFATKNDAILAWGLTYYPRTTANYYWNSWLYKNPKTGMFFYGTAVIKPGDLWRVRLGTSSSRSTVGWIHTHEITGNSHTDSVREQFSGVKRDGTGDGQFVIDTGLPGYLVTPSGVVRRLDPSWQRENISPIPNDYSLAVSIVLEIIFSRQG